MYKRLRLLDLLGDSAQSSPDANYPVTSENMCTLNNTSLLTGSNVTVDKAFVGLGNVDNVADINKPVSTPTLNLINTKQNVLVSGTNIKFLANVDMVGSGNITLAQLNLDKVDNTRDLDKPVPNSVTTQLQTKQDTLVSGQNIKTLNTVSLLGSGDIVIDKTTLGIDKVNNTSDLEKPVSTATQTQLNTKQPTLFNQQNIKSMCGINLLGSGDITLSDIGLGSISNTPDMDKPISTQTQAALDTKQDTLVNLQNIKAINGVSLLGPGSISLRDLNLDKVNNTADIDKPVSIATQNLLNTKQPTLLSGSNIKTIIGNHLIGSGDITAANLGIDRVNNTSDLEKPISVAVQQELDAKQAKLVSGTNIVTINGNSLLSGGNVDLNKNALGLNNVDNTSDMSKPVSTLVQAALNTKQNTLVDGVSIKTINSTSLLGPGNISIAPEINFNVISSNPMLSGSFANNTLTIGFSNRQNVYGFYNDRMSTGLYPIGGMAPISLGFYTKDSNTWGLKTNRFSKRMSIVVSVYGSGGNSGNMGWSLVVNGNTIQTATNFLPVYTYVNTTLIAQKVSIPNAINSANSTGVPLDSENTVQLYYEGPTYSVWTGYMQIILVDDV